MSLGLVLTRVSRKTRALRPSGTAFTLGLAAPREPFVARLVNPVRNPSTSPAGQTCQTSQTSKFLASGGWKLVEGFVLFFRPI